VEKIATTLYVVDLAMLLVFQLMHRDMGMIRHAISAYGRGKSARLFKTYLVSGSVAALLLAWQFYRAQAPAYPVMIPAYLVLVALGRVLIGLYPTDPRGAPRTRAGHIHHFATLLAFTCAYMTVVEATPLLAGGLEHGLPEALEWLRHIITLGFVAVVLTISPPLRRYFGLAERVFLYATALWFLTASLTLPPL
jgi:hypothetical membrane protein